MIYDSESEFNDGSSMDPAFLQGTAIKARYVRFDRFCIDQHRQQVSRNGARIRLQGKVYQVLIVLLQKQGEVVTREELKQALWSAHASRGGRCHLLDLSLCSATAPLRFAKSKVRLGRHPRYALPFGDIEIVVVSDGPLNLGAPEAWFRGTWKEEINEQLLPTEDAAQHGAAVAAAVQDLPG
jgi:hypothetical protein